MKIFASHSIKDKKYLDTIEKMLAPSGIKLLIAEHFIDIENTISQKIKKLIESCDIGLVLLTKSGFSSGFVREEIGYLEALNKNALLVFEKGVEKQYGGFKFGSDFDK